MSYLLLIVRFSFSKISENYGFFIVPQKLTFGFTVVVFTHLKSHQLAQDSIFDVQHCCARLLGFARPGLRRAAQEGALCGTVKDLGKVFWVSKFQCV